MPETKTVIIAIYYAGEKLKAFGTTVIICLCCAIGHLDFMGTKKKRGRRRIRTVEYWRKFYRQKQREWRAAHPRIRKTTRSNRESPIRVRQAQGSCECCDFVQEGYPRHPKGAFLAKQLWNVN